MVKKFDIMPQPLLPVQGMTYHLDDRRHLPMCFANRAYWPMQLETDTYYQDMQNWLQLARWWYYVMGQPVVHDSDYEAVRTAADDWHTEAPEEYILPLYWYWNHLPDRYDSWVKGLFMGVPINPRWPWQFGEKGIFNRPIDFSVQPSTIHHSRTPQTISSGKPLVEQTAHLSKLTLLPEEA